MDVRTDRVTVISALLLCFNKVLFWRLERCFSSFIEHIEEIHYWLRDTTIIQTKNAQIICFVSKVLICH